MTGWWSQVRSKRVFIATCVLFVAIKLLFDFYPGEFPVRGQTEAFTWPLVGAVILLGLAGLFAERSVGFPGVLADPQVQRRGWLIAALTGLAYGALTIMLPGSNPLGLTEWPHVPWPWSIPFYTFGTIFLEFMLRLGALCILVWLVHVVILRRRWLMPVFWTVNLIVAFYEIMPMTMQDVSRGDWGAVALTPLQPLYWTNVFEGWLLMRFGWLTPIVFRLAFYLVWHVVYGGLGPLTTADADTVAQTKVSAIAPFKSVEERPHKIQNILPVEAENSASPAAGSVETERGHSRDNVARAKVVRPTGIAEAGAARRCVVRQQE